MFQSRFLIGFFIFGLLVGGGCAGKKGAIVSGGPDWINKGSGAFSEKGGNIFHGVGAVTGIRNKPLAVTTADNRARAEIAKIFETYTASLMRDYAASTTGGAQVTGASATREEQSVEQAIKTFSSATLSGVMIIDHWADSSDGTIYALARLDLDNFKNSAERLNELSASVRDYVRKNAERSFENLLNEEERRKR